MHCLDLSSQPVEQIVESLRGIKPGQQLIIMLNSDGRDFHERYGEADRRRLWEVVNHLLADGTVVRFLKKRVRGGRTIWFWYFRGVAPEKLHKLEKSIQVLPTTSFVRKVRSRAPKKTTRRLPPPQVIEHN